MNINLTLVVQIIHFGIAYQIMYRIFFKYGFSLIKKEEAERQVIQQEQKLQINHLSEEQKLLDHQMHEKQKALNALIPSVITLHKQKVSYDAFEKKLKTIVDSTLQQKLVHALKRKLMHD